MNKGLKVMSYSTSCKTPLSNFEAAANKVKVSDPEAFIKLHSASFVAWTTIPLTLPSNLALCVNANFTYVKVPNKYSGKVYIVAESLLSAIHNPRSNPKKLYEPLFDFFKDLSDTAFRVVVNNFVTDDSSTGVFHCAPAFGEDDFRVCIDNQIISKDNLTVVVDDDGCFTEKLLTSVGATSNMLTKISLKL
ncbi:Isoleucine--tRNA ligase, cytoplasmic [Glycine max]|nr:Isoleucine--tRNA ligase, cytoplasmic [Glycine max]